MKKSITVKGENIQNLYVKPQPTRAIHTVVDCDEDYSEYSDDFEIQIPEFDENLELDMQETDIQNLRNPLHVARYAETIMKNDQLLERKIICTEDQFLKAQETCPNQEDMITPAKRNILVKWIINVHHYYSTSNETLFNAVIFIDLSLNRKMFPKDQLQLLGSVCFWMAAKIDEMHIPAISDIVRLCNIKYTKKQFTDMEMTVFQLLNFELQYPTVKTFLRRYLCAVNADQDVVDTASIICETTLLSHLTITHRPSAVALVVVALTIYATGKYVPMNILYKYGHFTKNDEIVECMPLVYDCINKMETICRDKGRPLSAEDKYIKKILEMDVDQIAHNLFCA